MRLRDQTCDVDALGTNDRVFRVDWDQSPAEHERGSREGLRSSPNRRDGLRQGDDVASLKVCCFHKWTEEPGRDGSPRAMRNGWHA